MQQEKPRINVARDSSSKFKPNFAIKSTQSDWLATHFYGRHTGCPRYKSPLVTDIGLI